MRERDTDIVETLDRTYLSGDQLRRLEVPGREIIVVINDSDAEQARQLAEAALTRNGLKLIFWRPNAEQTDPTVSPI